MDDFDNDLVVRWKAKRVFNQENDRFKNKIFLRCPFAKIEAYDFTSKMLYPFLVADFLNRYYKMNGNNVTLSLGLDSFSYKGNIFLRDNFISHNDIIDEYTSTLDKMGIGYDLRKKFTFNDLNVIKYIQNIFLNLYEKNIISFKKGLVYEDRLQIRMFNSFDVKLKNNTFYSKETNEEVFLQEDKYLSLNISSIHDKIMNYIKSTDMPLSLKEEVYKDLGLYKYMTTSLYNFKEHIKIDIDLKEPEYICGISFIVLNPQKINVMDYVDSEEVDTVNRYLQNGYQKGVFSGKVVKNPVTSEDIFIFISYDFDEAIHVAIPAINELDRQYAYEFGIEYKEIISDGVLINSDFLSGLEIKDARYKIIDTFLSEGMGVLNEAFLVDDIVISSKEEYGVLSPLFESDKDLNFVCASKSFLPIYFDNRQRIIVTNENSISQANRVARICFNDLFINGFSYLIEESLNTLLPSISDDSFVGDNIVIVNKNNVMSDYLFPIIISLLLDKPLDCKFIFLNQDLTSDFQISEYNNRKISFSKDLLKMYKADSYRMMIFRNKLDDDFDLTKIKIQKYKQYLDEVYRVYHEGFAQEAFNLEHSIYQLTSNLNFMIHENSFDLYLEAIMKFFYDNLLVNKMTENQALIYLKLLSPLAPFLTQKIFEEVFNQSYFLVYEEWPFMN